MGFEGCYTASVTPMKGDFSVDYEGLSRLIEFQIEQSVSGVLATGTTGESPTLSWDEHLKVVEESFKRVGGRSQFIAGTGSNSTEEAVKATEHSREIGVEAVLLVDPYYNGPSSLEIRREYIEPIASKFSGVEVIPYIIPGRTGTQLLPLDLSILNEKYSNVNTVKEATGDLENMKEIRRLCGGAFTILSGDDDKTFAMMASKEIGAKGVISVISNIAPKALQDMTVTMNRGDVSGGERIAKALKPLFEMVTVKTVEETGHGQVACKARNPLPLKTAMNILGMPAGPCRRPLGRMTSQGVQKVLGILRQVYKDSPEILEPVERSFDVSLDERLFDEKYWRGLFYDSY